MSARRCWFAGPLLSAVLAGCTNVAPPDWCHPGSAMYQRAQAERSDPYPLPDTGPEVVGGRPRDFQVPHLEPARDQTEFAWSRNYGRPPAGLFRSSSMSPRAPVPRYAGLPGAYGPPVYAGGAYPPGAVYPPMQGYAPAPGYAVQPPQLASPPAATTATSPAVGSQTLRSTSPDSGLR